MNTPYSRILVAPSAYKGTLSAREVADAIKKGIEGSGIDYNVVCVPIADGGDGTLDAIELAVNVVSHPVDVVGAVGQPVRARWLEVGEQAVIELACASGLAMLHGQELRPLEADTRGTGLVLLDSFQAGFTNVVLCVGGSASTDGGAGLLTALGARFLDESGKPLPSGGRALFQLAKCDLSGLEKWRHVRMKVATDVTSPLLGVGGAASIFAPQKGATPAQVVLLEGALERFADYLEAATGKAVRSSPGAGAAGGTAFGAACALNAEIVSGFAWLAEIVNLESKISQCDLVVTGEGRLDEQSLVGKATGELIKLCRRYNKSLWAVPAVSQHGVDWSRHGIDVVSNTAADGAPATAQRVTDVVADFLRR